MSDLQALSLSENNLDAEAAQWLSTGEWDHLVYLNVDDNLLDNAASCTSTVGHVTYVVCVLQCL